MITRIPRSRALTTVLQEWTSIENASYDSVSLHFGSLDQYGNTLEFKPDGTKLYIGGDSNDAIYQFSLSTPWDLSTASYDNKSYSLGIKPISLSFKPDGTKMYVCTYDTLYQYSLSTPWDITTATSDSISYALNAQDSGPRDVFFKPDGTKMYMIGLGSDLVYQYSLSTAWDLSTLAYDNISYSIAAQSGVPHFLVFSATGARMLIGGTTGEALEQYSLTTAWDLSEVSYDNVKYTFTGFSDNDMRDVTFKPDGTKFYAICDTDYVYQFSL